MKKHTRKGFTLIELIIVLAIIAVLTSMLVITMVSFIDKAKKKAMLANGKVIWDAATLAVATDEKASESFYTPQGSWTLFEGKPDGRVVMVRTTSTSTGKPVYHSDKVIRKNATLRGEGNYLFTVVTRVDGYNHGAKGIDTGDSAQITHVFNTWNYSDKKCYEVFVKKFCYNLNMSLNLQDGTSFPVKMPYTKRDDGDDGDFVHPLVRWLVCWRMDNRQIEVWAGDGYKAENGPVYRVYPDPCDFFY